MWKKYDRAGKATGDDAYAFHAGYIRQKIHTPKHVIMFFNSKNDYTNAPKCYVTRTLQVFL